MKVCGRLETGLKNAAIKYGKYNSIPAFVRVVTQNKYLWQYAIEKKEIMIEI